MMKLPGQRLDQAVSSLALLLSTASLICLIAVFIACTSLSAPESLYFLKASKLPSTKVYNILASLGEYDWISTLEQARHKLCPS